MIEPLSAYVDSTNQDTFKLGHKLIKTFPLKTNVAKLQDNIYSTSIITETKLFFGVEKPAINIGENYDGSNVMVSYVFNEAVTYTEFTRSRYNLIDVLTEVGGIWNSVYLGGYMFTMMFSYNLMMSSIIGKLYSFNTKFASEPTEEARKEKKKKGKEKKQKDDSRVETKNNDQFDGDEDDEGLQQ